MVAGADDGVDIVADDVADPEDMDVLSPRALEVTTAERVASPPGP